ncbi:hypothetical protein TrLO_g8236 [Triparma laevis f. longispina]|uniref:Uncharacterized protein n=1 Tax=Triparma laevis f. longispina TaxID=1714387 RepID=A0A9W7CMS6_9STRA|nr:hypothetical protein TrLO_g8236 [Triparma laevis f. longispina]
MHKSTLLYLLCASIICLLFMSISHQRIYEYLPQSPVVGVEIDDAMLKAIVSPKTEAAEVAPTFAYNKTNLYVISLQDVPGADPHNAGRRDQFQRDWAALCGAEFTFEVCPGVLDKRRGFGITQSFVNCFERAISDGAANPIFFEDDARLFNADFCRGVDWTDLPMDTFVALLGGWHFRFGSNSVEGYKELTFSSGAYGFMVPHHNLKALTEGFRSDLNQTSTEKLWGCGKDCLSPDESWYKHAKLTNKRIYAVDPLVVMHPAGWSNTWHKHRKGVGGVEGNNRMYVIILLIGIFATGALLRRALFCEGRRHVRKLQSLKFPK